MEEFKGRLSADGNRAGPATGKAGLTASLTRRADAKAERSDPMAMVSNVECGKWLVVFYIPPTTFNVLTAY